MRHKRYLLLLLCLAVARPQLQAQSKLLIVELQGSHLRVAAPQLQFLEGKPLEQLHNGASVAYALELTIAPDRGRAPLFRLQEQFIVSYDLWEEKFSVVRAGPSGRSASHLTAAQAVAWCLESMLLPKAALPAEKTFVIELECRITENEAEGGTESRPALSLAGLIDVFSRREREAPPRWQAVSGTLRMADLRDKKNPK